MERWSTGVLEQRATLETIRPLRLLSPPQYSPSQNIEDEDDDEDEYDSSGCKLQIDNP